MKTDRKAFLDRALSLLFVLSLMAGVYVYYLLARLIPFYDAVQFFSPYFTLLADFGRAGQFLLWDPYQNCGSPDIGYPELGGFSPLTLGLAVLTDGGYTGFLIYWLTVWAIFGLGTCRLALHLGAPRWAAMAVAAGLMFSGFFLGSATHTSIIYGFSFLPLILWRLDAGLIRRRWWPVVEAGALYGLSALASHPQMVIVGGMYLGLWAAGRALFPEDGAVFEPAGRRSVRAALGLCLLLAVALLVLSPVYGNFFHETAGYSERAGYLPRSHAISYGELPVSALATLASPYLPALTVFNPDLWPGTLYLLAGCHVGAIIPALALALLILKSRRRFAWWVAGMGIFFLAAALGDATPVRGWLYDLLPPTRFFRHSSIFRAYFLFSLGVMAMLAAEDLSRPAVSARAWKTVFFISAALLPLMAAAFFTTLLSVDNRGLWPRTAIGHFAVTWVGAVAVAAYGWRAAKAGNAATAARLLLCLAVIDAAGSLYLSRTLMAVPRERFAFLETERVRSIDLSPLGLFRFRRPPDVRVNNSHLISKRPMLEGYNQMANRFHSSLSLTSLPQNWTTEPALYSAVTGPESRIWFCPQVAFASPSDATFLAFIERSRQLGAMPLVLSRPAELMRLPARGLPGPDDVMQSWAIRQLPACQRVAADVIVYTPTQLTLRVDSPGPGWLLVTDRWSRSWRAKVNGREEEIMGGNFLFRAVAVGQGQQTVEFVFHPWLFPFLLYVSWGTMALVVVIGLGRWRRPGRPSGPIPSAARSVRS